jgi:hypothetical protein
MDDLPGSVQLPTNPARVLVFIRAFYRRHGLPPSEHELASELAIAPGLANYYLRFLERGGYIHRQRGLIRNIALTALGVSVLIPGEIPGTQRPVPNGAPAAKVLRLLEQVFPYGNDDLCDICGRVKKASEDRFCAGCRHWLTAFARSRPKGSSASVALDMAHCLSMMLRYHERPCPD